jgi:cell division septation protein DedD
MTPRLSWCGLAILLWTGLLWTGVALADPASDLETLESATSAHSVTFAGFETEHTNVVLGYRSTVDTLIQRLRFGSTPNNPALVQSLQAARDALGNLGGKTQPLEDLTSQLVDDAARANAIAHDLRAASTELDANEPALQALAKRLAATTDKIYQLLGQALDERRKQADLLKTENQALTGLAQAVEAGKLPGDGTADAGLAAMLAPPALMAPPAPGASPAAPSSGTVPGLQVEHPPPSGRWSIQFGLFQNEDDAGYIMARLSMRGIQSHYVPEKDKRGHPAFKVVTRGFPTRAAAEAAATEMGADDLHPSGVVELPE